MGIRRNLPWDTKNSEDAERVQHSLRAGMAELVDQGQSLAVGIHDSTQIELKTVYSIPQDIPLDEQISFIQDVYFFIPRTMGINAGTYPKEEFYRSLTNYIRIKTPSVLDDDERHHARIDKVLPHLYQAWGEKRAPDSLEEAVQEIRLFGSYVNDQFKVLLRGAPSEETREFLEDIAGLLRAYRELMDGYSPILEVKGYNEVVWAFRYVDEFLSNRFEEAVVELHHKGVELTSLMEVEFLRRRERGYPQILESQTEGARELFTFRMGRLKKYVGEVLYLAVVRQKRGYLFTNLAAAISALAAAFVSAMLDPNSRASVSWVRESLAQSLSLMVVAVTFVYMFKDRIKDNLKSVLMYFFRPWIPDYSFSIKSRQGREIGRCQEEMSYLSFEDVPEVVRWRRKQKDAMPLPMDGHYEEVVHYRRRMKMTRGSLEGLVQGSTAIKDILRFDLNPFLDKLSNPLKQEEFVGNEMQILKVDLPKVYHVNFVVHHKVKVPSTSDLIERYSHVRIIIDKNGIRRIEMVRS